MQKADQTLIEIFQDGNDRLEKHPDTTCAKCKAGTIIGYRYSCLDCQDLDLCEDCYDDDATPINHKRNHLTLLIKKNLKKKEREKLGTVLTDVEKTVQELGGLYFYGSTCSFCYEDDEYADENNKFIKGPLVKCDDCYDYNLCWKCYTEGKTNKSHKKDHKMIANFVAFRKEFSLKDIDEGYMKLLGKGCFGSVHETRLKSNGKVLAFKTLIALKDKPNFKLQEKSFRSELRAYSEIVSSKTLQYYGYAIVKEKDRHIYYLLTELMTRGCLEDYLVEKKDKKKKELPSFRRRFQWMFEVIRGLRKIHKKNFVHKDIKPDNLLLSNINSMKIGDMGVASYDEQGMFKDYIAPKLYAAPEILKQNGAFTVKADIFSFGLVMNYIFTEVEHGRKLDGDVIFEKESFVFKRLIERCVSKNPKERPTSQEIVDMFTEFNTHFETKVNMKKYATFKEEQKNFVFCDVIDKARKQNLMEFL